MPRAGISWRRRRERWMTRLIQEIAGLTGPAILMDWVVQTPLVLQFKEGTEQVEYGIFANCIMTAPGL
jgi:hypothetical protein